MDIGYIFAFVGGCFVGIFAVWLSDHLPYGNF